MIVTVQSANRSEKVGALLKKIAPIDPIFYVPMWQVDDYKSAGANYVVGVDGVMPMKPKQLNAALNDFKGETIVTMDDDFVSCVSVTPDKKAKGCSMKDLIEQALEEFEKTDAELAGFSTTSNPFFLRTTESESFGMITGQILFHKSNGILFDEDMNEMEDLEFIIQHHLHKGILKINRFVVNFHIFGRNENDDAKYSGGYKGFRTKETEFKTYNYMRNKHPTAFSNKIEYTKTADIPKRVMWEKLTERGGATLF